MQLLNKIKIKSAFSVAIGLGIHLVAFAMAQFRTSLGELLGLVVHTGYVPSEPFSHHVSPRARSRYINKSR
jgi:hypothetical protein